MALAPSALGSCIAPALFHPSLLESSPVQDRVLTTLSLCCVLPVCVATNPRKDGQGRWPLSLQRTHERSAAAHTHDTTIYSLSTLRSSATGEEQALLFGRVTPVLLTRYCASRSNPTNFPLGIESFSLSWRLEGSVPVKVDISFTHNTYSLSSSLLFPPHASLPPGLRCVALTFAFVCVCHSRRQQPDQLLDSRLSFLLSFHSHRGL